MKTLLTMSLGGGLMALTVALVRALAGGRLHPRVLYALWLPVLIALMIPVRLPSPVSFQNAPAVRRLDAAVTQRMESPLRTPAQPDPAPLDPSEGHSVQAAAQGEEAPSLPQSSPVKTDRRSLDAWDVAFLVWAAGALTAAAYIAAVNGRFRARMRRSRRPVEPPGEMQGRLRGTRVYLSKAAPSPCLVGVIRPYILVTPAAVASEQRMVHVLTHELSHRQQGDAVWALMRCAALAVHWFNPVVWLAAALSREDCENACDALTIRTLGEEERLDYGRTLLSFLRVKRTASGLVNAATTMAQSKKQIRRRIALIAKKRRYTLAAAALAVLLVLTGCAVTMTGAPDEDGTAEPMATVTIAPTPTPDEEEGDTRPGGPLRSLMDDYEQAIEPVASGFENMDPEEVKAALPELAADFVLYGRKNAAGDAYVLAYLPDRPTERAYEYTFLAVSEISQGDEFWWELDWMGQPVEEGEWAESIVKYELHDGLCASGVSFDREGNRVNALFIVLSNPGGGKTMTYLTSTDGARRELVAREMGLTTIPPDTYPHMEVYMMTDDTVRDTGYETALPFYFLLTDEEWAQLEPYLDAREPIDEKSVDWGQFWEDAGYGSTMYLHTDADSSWMCNEDFALLSQDSSWAGIVRQKELIEAVRRMAESRIGFDPQGFSNDWFDGALAKATLSFPSWTHPGTLVQTLEDEASLEALRALLRTPQERMIGGSACPFGGRLELERADGQTLTLYAASDSCGVLTYQGTMYFSIKGGQEALLDLFPECNTLYSSTWRSDGGAEAPAVDDTAYVGEYLDEETGEPSLEIARGEDGRYAVQIGIYRLTVLSDGVGELTQDGLRFTATDASGKAIGGTITADGKTATVTFTDSSWEYLKNGDCYSYTKRSDQPKLWD